MSSYFQLLARIQRQRACDSWRKSDSPMREHGGTFREGPEPAKLATETGRGGSRQVVMGITDIGIRSSLLRHLCRQLSQAPDSYCHVIRTLMDAAIILPPAIAGWLKGSP